MDGTADALDAGLLQFSTAASVGTGGFIETPNQRLAIHHVLPIVDAEDLAPGRRREAGRRGSCIARRRRRRRWTISR